MQIEKIAKGIEEVIRNQDTAIQHGEIKGTDYRRIYLKTDHESVIGLIQSIRETNELKIFNDQFFGTPSGWQRVSLYMLSNWLVSQALKSGTEKVLKALQAFLSVDYTSGIEIVAVSGIKLSKEIELFDGIKLAPIEMIPSEIVRRAIKNRRLEQCSHGQSFFLDPFNPLFRAEKLPQTALYCECHWKPRFASDFNQLPNIESRSEPLNSILSLITLIGPSGPIAYLQWAELSENMPFIDKVKGCSSLQYDIISDTETILNDKDLEELQNLCRKYFGLNKKIRNALSVPLARLNLAIRRKAVRDKAIELGIAFEALFLTDRSANDPISLLFRLRGAWLLGKNTEERHHIERLLNSIYTLRSEAVHTGDVPNYISQKSAESIIDEGIKLCSNAIRLIIYKGDFPHWNNLLIGGDRFKVDIDTQTKTDLA